MSTIAKRSFSKASGFLKQAAAWQKRLAQAESLNHWPDRSQPFDFAKSEIMRAMIADEKFLAWAFERAQPYLAFDAETKLWYGIETERGRQLLAQKQPETDEPAQAEEAA